MLQIKNNTAAHTVTNLAIVMNDVFTSKRKFYQEDIDSIVTLTRNDEGDYSFLGKVFRLMETLARVPNSNHALTEGTPIKQSAPIYTHFLDITPDTTARDLVQSFDTAVPVGEYLFTYKGDPIHPAVTSTLDVDLRSGGTIDDVGLNGFIGSIPMYMSHCQYTLCDISTDAGVEKLRDYIGLGEIYYDSLMVSFLGHYINKQDVNIIHFLTSRGHVHIVDYYKKLIADICLGDSK